MRHAKERVVSCNVLKMYACWTVTSHLCRQSGPQQQPASGTYEKPAVQYWVTVFVFAAVQKHEQQPHMITEATVLLIKDTPQFYNSSVQNNNQATIRPNR
eukprot:17014-Heterococcus_DN1.PRE.1